ncbi:hypothetical protein A9Q99_24245 [Gammaproteobacteria bacterium 45_16_T64]|nr:hypothetical protein A9Q99_24245 [Gammaproteobacteria bacterium 45_16_T64]
MLDALSTPILVTGLGLGLLHAFDADHVMAVSSLASGKQKTKTIARYASLWAVGHGSVLLMMGFIAILFGLTFPSIVSHWAELFVGVMLIGLGAMSLRSLYKERLHLKAHSHGDIHHAHFVQHSHVNATNSHDHRPLLVGIAHGAAGSAPALALLPAINQSSALSTILYLVIFSFGLLVSMSLFGILLGYSQKGLKKIHEKSFDLFRGIASLSTMGLGVYWIAG